MGKSINNGSLAIKRWSILAIVISAIPLLILLSLTLNALSSALEEAEFRKLYLKWSLQYIGLWVGFAGSVMFAYVQANKTASFWSKVSLGLVVVGLISAVLFEVEWWNDPKKIIPFGFLEIPMFSFLILGYAISRRNESKDI